MTAATGVQADVCLVLEGTYPYVFGGVSKWVHELLQAQRELSFHLVTIMPPGHEMKTRFEIPRNVVGRTDVVLSELPRVRGSMRGQNPHLFRRLESSLHALQSRGRLESLAELIAELDEIRERAGQQLLLNSRDAWSMLLRLYEARHRDTSFIDYFWSFRAMMSGLYSVLLSELPRARVYHAVSTGYAGLYAARARIATGRPVLLTEHGIYTNERRIELEQDVSELRRELKELELRPVLFVD